MPNLGLSELIVILMILLLVFGASRLPQLGESLGRTIRGFKRGFASNDQITVSNTRSDAPAAPAAKKPEGETAEAEVSQPKR